MSTRTFYISTIATLLVAIAITMSGCSGSGFVALGGSGAFYDCEQPTAPEIVRNQPTQSVTVGRARMLPMVGK